MDKKIIIVVIVTSLILITFGYFSEKERYPECFVTNEKCEAPYDKEPMFYENGELVQCCRKPHYLLQGLDSEGQGMTQYCRDFKTDIFDKNITSLSKY